MDSIVVENLEFFFENKKIFDHVNLKIEKNKTTVILGKNSCGKTTLAKILEKRKNYQNYKGFIFVNQINLFEDKEHISNVMTVIYNELFELEGSNGLEILRNSFPGTKASFQKKIEEWKTIFSFDLCLKIPYDRMNKSQKQYIYILSKLISDPDIIIIDEPFSYLNPSEKKEILSYLKSKTVVLLTSNVEDLLYSDDIYLLTEKKSTEKIERKDLAKNEKQLRKMGFSLPFMIDLSQKLKYYGLLKEEVVDVKEMVNHLWK